MSDSLLRLSRFVCLRGEKPLFLPVDLALGTGKRLHIQAANGCGKTTMLRAIYGMAIDWEGEIHWQGKQLTNHATLSTQCAYMNDRAGIYPRLSTLENLKYMVLLAGVQPSNQGCAEALARMGLSAQTDLLAQQLSKGQKKRLHMARLQLLDKALWLLDEPFDGLDAQAQSLLQELLVAQCGAGGTVIFSSHLGGDALPECDQRLLLEPWQLV